MTSQRILGIEKNLIIIFGVTLIAVMGIASITPAFPGIIQYLFSHPSFRTAAGNVGSNWFDDVCHVIGNSGNFIPAGTN